MSFLWIHSCVIPENDRADALASAAHARSLTILIGHYMEAHRIVREYERHGDPDERVFQCHPPSHVLCRWNTRAAATVLHRLPVHCAFTRRDRSASAWRTTPYQTFEEEENTFDMPCCVLVPPILTGRTFSILHFAMLESPPHC